MSRRLVLLRHGRTAWNAARRIQGQADVDLDDVGLAQAEAAAPAVAKMRPAVLWSSDLLRTRRTVAPVARATGLEPHFDARLREFTLGEREGLDHAEYEALDAEEYRRFRSGHWDEIPGAETAAQVADRMTSALRELAAGLDDDALGVAVSHGAAIRVAVAALLDWPLAHARDLRGLDNCTWVELEQRGPDPAHDRWALRTYGGRAA